MCCYLFWSLIFNELLVNAVGLGEQVFGRRVVPEILTGRPKLDVLFAELGFGEDAESSFPICGGGGREGGKRSVKDEGCIAVCPFRLSKLSAKPLQPVLLRPINCFH